MSHPPSQPPLSEDDARLLELANDSSDDSDTPSTTSCKYPSKFCGNPRAAKASGKLHRFCEIHRHRANNNQKRWTAVRRQVARERESRERQQLHHDDAMLMDPTWATATATTATAMATYGYYGMATLPFDDGYSAHSHQYLPHHPQLCPPSVPFMETVYK